MAEQYAENPGLRFCKILRGTKRPFEKDWVKKPYTWQEIQSHVEEEGNFGVLCGYGDLIVIDCDENELHSEVRKCLPETFEVLTGSGGRHCYYFCPEIKKKMVLQNDAKHYGEVQSYGAQVVAAGSLHPNGRFYEVNIDRPIAKAPLEQITTCIKPFMKEVVASERQAVRENRRFDSEIDSINITSVLNMADFREAENGEFYGANPWHGSSTGMNFWVNPSKNVGYCFRCNAGISVAKAIALNEGIIKSCTDELRGDKFLQVLRVSTDKYGPKPNNYPFSTDKPQLKKRPAERRSSR